MDASHLHRRRGQCALDGFCGRSARHGESELRVVLARLDELVRVGFDARCHPDEDSGRLRSVRHQVFDPVQLLEAVHRDPADTGVECHCELGDRLVVPVEYQPIRGDPGVERNEELAAGGHVDPHPLLGGESRHGSAQEGLRRVDGAIRKALDRSASTLAEVLLVVDEERCAVLGCQPIDPHATDGERAVGFDRRVVREKTKGNGRHAERPYFGPGVTCSEQALLGRLLGQIPPSETVDADSGCEHARNQELTEESGCDAGKHGGDDEGGANAVERPVHGHQARDRRSGSGNRVMDTGGGIG